MAKKVPRPDHWTLPVDPAPGDLMLIQDLVSTSPDGPRKERLPDPRALAGWFADWSLDASEVGDGAFQRVLELRNVLFALVRHNPNVLPDDETVRAWDEIVSKVGVRMQAGKGGVLRLVPSERELDGIFGRLAVAVLNAQQHGNWQRLKVCGEPKCRAVYYSGPRVTRWCSRRCGNRVAKREERRRS